MKAFIVALAVLATVTVFVAYCSITLTSGCDALEAIAGEFPDESFSVGVDGNTRGFDTAYADFMRTWAELRSSVRYFAGNIESDSVEDALDELKSRYVSGDSAGYKSALERLVSSLGRIKASESFTADSLF